MYLPDHIYIEEKVRFHPFINKILTKLPNSKVRFVEDYRRIGEEKPFALRAAQDKNSIALAEKKGEVLKRIGRMEEGQYYLFHEIDCRYDCEYCYLQYYFQTKVPVIFVNRDEILLRIEEILRSQFGPYFHVGEVCDALAFDDLTDFSLSASKLFSRYRNGVIEFRTKSTNIGNLLSIKDPPMNIIPSWTLSPEVIVRAIEHRTPSFSERLNAAKKCQEVGYIVGVRLDPIITFEHWEIDYRAMVEQLLGVLDPKGIDYISLGTVKLHKLLIDAIKSRFPDSTPILGELVPSNDGKYRNTKFERVDVYRKMLRWIREIDKDIRIQLSIESQEVEELVFRN